MPAIHEDKEQSCCGIPETIWSEESGEEEIHATFIDRAIPFVALIWPFSYLISVCQEFLRPLVPTTIANLSVLVGIIAFLVAVGWLSKRIYRFRKTWAMKNA
ncbi:MAG: hypothetical protein V1792_26250 [Pseudomonadota bacterium]